MPEDPLEERVAAVERAVGEASTTGVSDPDDAVDLREPVDTLEADVAELEAAVQAVRGYVGGVKHVNDEVEQRADAALAKAESVEHALESGIGRRPGCDGRPGATAASGGSGDRASHSRHHGSDQDATERAETGHDPPNESRSQRPGTAATQSGVNPPVGGRPDGHPRGASGDDSPRTSPDRCPRCGETPSADASSADGGQPPGTAIPGAGRVPDSVGERTLGEQPDDGGRDGWIARLWEVM